MFKSEDNFSKLEGESQEPLDHNMICLCLFKYLVHTESNNMYNNLKLAILFQTKKIFGVSTRHPRGEG